ncbi:MAG: hypothetical protein HKO02_09860 [Hyphomonadaceae bacterium]|nr:hypothetical protein [Hyphomonadaceae bacterium]
MPPHTSTITEINQKRLKEHLEKAELEPLAREAEKGLGAENHSQDTSNSAHDRGTFNPAQNLAMARPVVVINKASGSTSDITDVLKHVFMSKVGVSPVVRFVSPEVVEQTMKEAIGAGANLLVTYGGDGTSRTGADLAKEHDIPFIPLPGGTMNLLPLAIYGSDNWEEVLSLALSQKEPRWLPAGEVNGHTFYVGAILGETTRFSEVREKVRDHDIVGAAQKAVESISNIRGADPIKFQVAPSTEEHEADAIVLTCPGMRGRRGKQHALEIASIEPESARDVASLGLNALWSNWRDDESAKIMQADTFFIPATETVEALLDGESCPLDGPVIGKLQSKGVKILAPKISENDRED